MAKEVLSEALVHDLSNQIDITVSPVSPFAFDLGFDSASGSAAEQLATLTQRPHEKYVYILNKFVATHGRGEEAAQFLIDRFKVTQKKDLVNFLEEAIKKQSALKQSGRRQEPGLAEGQGQTGTEIRPLNAGASARNKSFRKFEAGLSLVVALLAIVAACTWNNLFPEYIAESFSLEECQDALRKHYENHLFKIHIRPWVPYDDVDLEKLYTTLSLYKEVQNDIPDRPTQKLTLNGSVNDIFQTKVRGSLPERIVLFGEAGRGKTTAVAKMAYDWVNKKEDSPLKNVKLLFVFKMRYMNAKTGIAEAIVPLLGMKYYKYQKQLEDYIDSHEKDVVMLFDGYDEFSGELHCREHVGDIIDILCQARCRQCRVLVTSRPVRIKDFYSRCFYSLKVVIEGYSQQHATDFIDKFFLFNETTGTELKKYLEEDIIANEMIATPLFCTMVCYLWSDGFINGNYTQTNLFDDIMELLRTHLNAKDEQAIDMKQDLLNDTVVSVGQVAYTKLSNKNDNPLVLSEDDFSGVQDDKVNISYLLGLLTKKMKTDSDIIIYIEFFHRLAQEYSAGRYLASGLNEEEEVFDLKEMFKDGKLRLPQVTASRVVGIENLPESVKEKITSIDIEEINSSPYVFARLWNSMHTSPLLSRLCLPIPANIRFNLKHLTSIRVFETHNVLSVSSLAHVLTFLPKIRELVIQDIEPVELENTKAFFELWKNLHTSPDLNRLHLPIPSSRNILCDLEPLRSVQVFETKSSLIHLPILLIKLPNLQQLFVHSDITSIDIHEANGSPDLFVRLWNSMNTSFLLSSLILPIPAGIRFNLKHLTSIRRFKASQVISVRSLAHVLTFLPKIRELLIDIEEIELVELDYNPEAFCKLWKNLHTSPHLNRLLLPIPTLRNNPCDLEPLRSVQVFETKSSSIHLPILLIKLPNLQQLFVHSDIPVDAEFDVESADNLVVDFWIALHTLPELHHLTMNVPESVPALLLELEPLRSVQTFKTKINSQIEVFPILLSRLPNISELDIFATNNYNTNIAEDTYYDKVVSAIIDGLVKNGVQLKVLNMTFDPEWDESKTVSRDTVENFIQMLKTSCMMRQLEIISFDYCVFNEADLMEIITAIREFTSIMILRIDCSLHSEGELSRFAIQQEENQDINKSEQSGSLMLTLVYSDPETEVNFVLPRSQ